MVEAIVGNPSVHNILRPWAPYVPHVQVSRELELKVIKGIKLLIQKIISYVSKLFKSCTELDIKFI